MLEVSELLALSKNIATQAGLRLLESSDEELKNHVYSNQQPKEIKALADTVLEKEILNALIPIGLPILSEESGYISGESGAEYWFIIDPLDGTFNFVKDLGPSAVCIALWKEQTPVFGVIYNLSDRKLYWGGSGLGAYCDEQAISVSDVSNKSKASICTGFPVRFNVESDSAMENFWHMIKPFAKIRMLGSAAVSLLSVAKGSADIYSEDNIMLWDVAAGLAIIEGAGGTYAIHAVDNAYSYKVRASNASLLI